MMDLLYSYRASDDGWNLRMSLRSHAANMANVGKVVVAGDPPDWLSDGVVKVPCGSPYDRKQKNILHAVFEAMERGAIEGPCLYSSDDHFIMSKFDADRFPWFKRQGFWERYPALPELLAAGKPPTPYRLSMAATRNLFAAVGLPLDNWSGHFDTHLDRRDMDAVKELARGWETSPWGYEPSSLFIAAARRRDPSVEGTPCRDLKLRSDLDAAGCGEYVRGSSGFISVADSEGLPMFRGWMEARFPEPCRWERT